jgi:hypothetical protein
VIPESFASFLFPPPSQISMVICFCFFYYFSMAFCGSGVKRENTLNISKENTIFINFKMQIQEGNGHIYSNPRGLDYNSKK